MVAHEQGGAGLGVNVDPVLARSAYAVETHHVAYRSAKAHPDRVSLGVTERVARDHIAIAALELDRDALAASRLVKVRGAVSGDLVVVAEDEKCRFRSPDASVCDSPDAVRVQVDSG